METPAVYQRLTIADGALGPVAPGEVEARPFTVFVGRQGTGKSLVAQVLYFFQDLPVLQVFGAPGAEALHVLDNIRTSNRAFATFANPTVTLSWTVWEQKIDGNYGWEKAGLELHGSSGVFWGRMGTYTRGRMPRVAIYIPTERLFFSQFFRNPAALQVLSLPTTMYLFADWIDRAGKLIERWKQGEPDTPEGQWVRRKGRHILAGEALRQNGMWKWSWANGTEGDREPLSIDMASSGQRANWPIIALAETLFTLRDLGEVEPSFTLYIEEPEIHLHPEAQVALVEILAFLVNHGFRVVLTTHSLTVLYALNNLTLASSLPDDVTDGVPEPAVRLRPESVAAYCFRAGEAPEDIVEHESGFISEKALGEIGDDLSDQMNRIGMLGIQLSKRVEG